MQKEKFYWSLLLESRLKNAENENDCDNPLQPSFEEKSL